jgi:tRNA(fMet)-specific endonuclease VapC
MYLLDTDILTLAHAGHARIAERMRQAGEANLATTLINAIEILQGRYDFLLKASNGPQLLRAQELLNRSEGLLQDAIIISIKAAAAATFDRLLQDKKARRIGRADLLIASVALAEPATLVTRNLRDFRQVPGLQVENWAD